MKRKHQTKLPSIPAPRGFHWKIRQRTDTCEIQLCNRQDVRVGSVHLYLVNLLPIPEFETHSELDANYWGKGWGTKLYAKAIHWCLSHGFKVRSSSSPSKYAKRVWRSDGLRKLFMIRNIKTVTRDDYGRYSSRTFRAYSKPISGKKKAFSHRVKRYSRYGN